MLLLWLGIVPVILADRLTVSHYENKLNTLLGGKTSPLHPGKVKRYRCIEEYVDIEPPSSVLEFKAWHKVAPPKEERSMNLKMDDRRRKEEKKEKKETRKNEGTEEIEHTPTVGIQYHEQSRSSQDSIPPLHRNRSRRRHHLDYYPMEYYDDYDYMPVYRRPRRRRLPYAYRMKRMLPGSSRLDDPSSYLLKSPSLAPLPRPLPLPSPVSPSPLTSRSPRPLRSQLNVRRLAHAPLTVTPSPPLTTPLPSSLPLSPILLQKEKATPETCKRMTSLASQFGITDVLDWASSNCVFLQGFAPGRSCQEILEFIASCKQ